MENKKNGYLWPKASLGITSLRSTTPVKLAGKKEWIRLQVGMVLNVSRSSHHTETD